MTINKLYIWCLIMLGCYAFAKAQPSSSSLMGLPKLSTTEMNSVVNPNEGSIIYNTTDDSIYLRTENSWVVLRKEESKAIILNKNGGSLQTATNTFFNLPINSTHVTNINNSYYELINDASVRIKVSGNYLITGELSVTNMPIGSTKYILGVFLNGSRSGYLSRGSVTLPSSDYWGTTGAIMFNLNTNDIVDIRYVLNANGSILSANFLNMGITKI